MNTEKLSTIQKRHNLNEVLRIGEPGPGGAHHDYLVALSGSGETSILIEFQRGPRLEEGSRHGVLDVDLLEIVRDRLIAFQRGEFSTRENACALTHVEEALMWMNKRTEDRAERCVLGTNQR